MRRFYVSRLFWETGRSRQAPASCLLYVFHSCFISAADAIGFGCVAYLLGRHLCLLLPTPELTPLLSLKLQSICACICVDIFTCYNQDDFCFIVKGRFISFFYPPPTFSYPLPRNICTTQVCLTYAMVNPFILVVGIPYFFSCQLTYKHQMLFVYEPLYETGGVFFPKIFRRFIFALIIAQVIDWLTREEGDREEAILYFVRVP